MALPPLPSVLHPLLVHFPLALLPTAAAFVTWYAWRGDDWTRKAGYATLTAAAFFALLAMGSGFREYFEIAPTLEGTEARDVMEWHERLGVITAVTTVIVTGVAWWARARVAASGPWRIALAVAVAGATLLVVLTGWFGGSLVFDLGVGTPDSPASP